MRYGRPLDDLYFEWLCELVDAGNPIDPKVLIEFYKTPFEDTVPNDQNRAEDGLSLRQEFMLTKMLGTRMDSDWLGLECSVLEMLIALADRAAFQTGWSSSEWFEIFMENLGVLNNKVNTETALRKLNRRTYAANGKGGLFPLKHPAQDQRKVELWYQMSAYLLENIDF